MLEDRDVDNLGFIWFCFTIANINKNKIIY